MNENKHFNCSEKPPKRLFRAIIGRLKIEKVLKISKKRFLIFLGILAISAILVIAAILISRAELSESESVSLISLLFSDTGMVLLQFKYFILAVLESIPIMSVLISSAAVALLMISLRFAVGYYEKITNLNKLIKK